MNPTEELLSQLHALLGGHRVAQAIHVVAKLGIADLLADGPRTCDELARDAQAHSPSLCRVLRFLAAVGLFDEVEPQRFALTPLGSGLRSDVPGSRWPYAQMLLEPSTWNAWSELLETVRTGATAFERLHGMTYFDYLEQHPDLAEPFHQAMAAGLDAGGKAFAATYDMCGFERVVDVGGGHGELLTAVLQACPRTRGVLFDRPDAVAGARAALEAAGVAKRCEFVSGNFFESIPSGGDAYVFRQIIHDWADREAAMILQNCRAAIRPTGKLLLVERRISANPEQALPTLHTDMQMLAIVGGRERSTDEYRALMAEAGFELTKVTPLGARFSYAVFEGVPQKS